MLHLSVVGLNCTLFLVHYSKVVRMFWSIFYVLFSVGGNDWGLVIML